jgi:hypothetical protein
MQPQEARPVTLIVDSRGVAFDDVVNGRHAVSQPLRSPTVQGKIKPLSALHALHTVLLF